MVPDATLTLFILALGAWMVFLCLGILARGAESAAERRELCETVRRRQATPEAVPVARVVEERR